MSIPGYSCYCPNGYYYETQHLECIDNDECLDEEAEPCVGGHCINTIGSYYCSCTAPLVLDPSQRRCVTNENEDLAVCWQEVGPDLVCRRPRLDRRVTYTECCCLYGEAWSMNCALCPEGAAQAMPVQKGSLLASLGLSPAGRFGGSRGLPAEECGILSGCENGRCIQVADGFTCFCNEGYRLDPTHMACRDIDECREVDRLCSGGRCLNLEGSYRCLCPPGTAPAGRLPRCLHTPRSRA
uniref:Latent transforming growth factor beta binding protein 4 n=1 Tax=Pseudonaja textilis TaxID=8673 RepID=A0A670ZRK0_PSETE